MEQNLGKLEKVDIRQIWEHEALSFTPWLATPENLAQLGDALGIDFDEDNIQVEVGVGDFNADILASDLSGKKIEGQWSGCRFLSGVLQCRQILFGVLKKRSERKC